MRKPSPNTRHIWEIEKNLPEEAISNLSSVEQELVLKFLEKPNDSFIDAEKVSIIEIQDGVTERWKYYLSDEIFLILEGYIPGPWSTSTVATFHICILQGIHHETET